MAFEVPKLKLGSQGLVVSAQGLGCMGMSGNYGLPKPEPDMIKLIHHAIDSGVTFLDTSDVYGPHTNEILIGKALKGGLREKVQIATKFGIRRMDGKSEVCGDPAYVRSACEASLKRLDIDCIDLYYIHRIDIRVPIEVTMGELKKLVEEGKVKYVGLSEASASTIRRAHAVHPITAVQNEWSLWSRDLEDEIVPTCRELGIGIVPYSPIGRGFLAVGPKLVENLIEGDFRKNFPRFQHVEHNKTIFEQVNEMATRKGCTAAQLALAWVHHQGSDVVPIPGTTKLDNFNQNIGALSVKLTTEEMAELESFASSDLVKGERHAFMQQTWINSETPPLSSWKGFESTKRSREKMSGVKRIKLGSQGLEVSALGLGCMGMSHGYGPAKPEEDMIKLIHHAINSGVTHLDTSDVYGPHTNELLVGKALKGVEREKVQLATKFGIKMGDSMMGKAEIHGEPEYVRAACEASLKRLDVDYIDLYYAHRIDTKTPIEVTMGELKKLVEEGKIKHIGLSEAGASTIRRAHAVHPITAIQLEWSLWTRDAEEEVIPTCRELGIGIVPFAPLGSGFFASGPKLMDNLADNDFRKILPRLQGENFQHNKVVYERVSEIAERKGCTPSQLALAWVLHQGDDVGPIPGTTKIENLNQNLGALAVKLTAEDMAELDSAASFKGARMPEQILVHSYKNSDTPPLSSWKSE